MRVGLNNNFKTNNQKSWEHQIWHEDWFNKIFKKWFGGNDVIIVTSPPHFREMTLFLR